MSDAMNEGLPVAGYRPQTDEAVALVNENKELEERVLRQMDAIRALVNEGEPDLIDLRWFAIARTQIEQGFMALNRSIFKPGRVRLADDDAPPKAGP